MGPLLAAAASLLLALPALGGERRALAVAGEARAYLLHAPAARPPQPAPLILAFHGWGSNGAQQERLSGLSAAADRGGFIVAYPEGSGSPRQRWRIGPREGGEADLGFVRAIVADVARTHPVDARRVFATGISNGAQMSVKLACAAPDLVAAIAPVAGGYFEDAGCAPGRPVPALVFHGTADRLLPYDGRGPLRAVRAWAATWATRNGCAPRPEQGERVGEARLERWRCPPGAAVALWTLESKGHSWPGSAMPAAITSRAIDATALIVAFFLELPG